MNEFPWLINARKYKLLRYRSQNHNKDSRQIDLARLKFIKHRSTHPINLKHTQTMPITKTHHLRLKLPYKHTSHLAPSPSITPTTHPTPATPYHTSQSQTQLARARAHHSRIRRIDRLLQLWPLTARLAPSLPYRPNPQLGRFSARRQVRRGR